MFIEERLEAAHLQGTVGEELGNIVYEYKADGLNGIRKVDYAWVAFCKKHTEYELCAVKAIAYHVFVLGGSDPKRAFEVLNWSKYYTKCKHLNESRGL